MVSWKKIQIICHPEKTKRTGCALTFYLLYTYSQITVNTREIYLKKSMANITARINISNSVYHRREHKTLKRKEY